MLINTHIDYQRRQYPHSYDNMASYEGRPLVMEMEHGQDYLDEPTGCGCGCFSFKWWRGHGEEDKHLLGGGRGGGETWMMEKLRKVKEASEVIAGPKWKTLIRKISGYVKKQKNNIRFQYDEHSYALNFNSGAQSEDEGNIPPSFSTRFAAPVPAGRRQNDS